MSKPRYLAGGVIAPCRFVKIDTTSGNNFTVVQASASSDKLIAVSQEGSRLAQLEGYQTNTNAATADGQNIRTFSAGEEALIELGGTVTQGDWITSDASGKGIVDPATGTVVIAGYAEEAGISGDKIRMFVHPFKVKYS